MSKIIDIIKVIILGIVEGITEFLPVSSTGHLIIVEEFMTLEPESFANAFMVIIQLGAIISVIVLNFDILNPFSMDMLPERLKKSYSSSNPLSKIFLVLSHPNRKTIRLWTKIIVAVIPAAVLGFLFDDLIDKYLFNPLVVAIALIVYGLILILIENKNKKTSPKIVNLDQIDYKTAFKIGIFQCLAMVPGTSRSASTIIGGLLLGTNRLVATQFSFYLAIPTMIGATLLKVVKNFGSYTSYQWMLIGIGFAVSFIIAYIVIKKFTDYVKKNDFKIFGYYRIILGLCVLILMYGLN